MLLSTQCKVSEVTAALKYGTESEIVMVTGQKSQNRSARFFDFYFIINFLFDLLMQLFNRI